MNEEYIIFAPNKDLSLANTISSETNILLGHMDVKKINDSETLVDIKSHVQNKDAFLIYNITTPVNDSLMEIYLISDTLIKNGARGVHLILPYLPYTRILDDQVNKINFNLIVRQFQIAGVTSIYTFDIYSPQLINAFKIPVYNINIKKVFSYILEQKFKSNKNLVVTTLDYELRDRAVDISKVIGCDFVYTTKIDENNDNGFEINKSVNEKDILLVGNRIASGELIVRFSNFLALKGAKNIYVIATHGLLSEGAVERLNDSIIKEIYIFSSPKSKISNKIKVVPYAPIYKEIITRITEKKNIISFIN
ncbi:MAG TPA: ribose-phosphate diphosphokinase [archaeon]|jgi:ribose-phosphate pyrophosphokinase|nr:ribose-phosphate diphosphokinase [archaeon]